LSDTAGGSCANSPDFSGFVEDDWDNVSPMGSVSYRIDDNKSVYGKISRGFTSGGFNGRAASAALFQVPFDEETLTSYEVGIKSRLHDNRVMLNASVYYNDYKDQQVTVFAAGSAGAVTLLENAGESEIKGGEIEVVAIPYDNTTVSLAYSYTDAEYTEYTLLDVDDADSDGSTTDYIDVADERAYALTPESTVNASVTYTWPGFELFGLESSGLTARLNYYWQDEMYFASTDYDLTAAGAYGLLNASLKMADVECEDGVLDLVLWGKNLTDEKYEEHGIDFGAAVGHAGNIYGAPLTAGLEIIYNYGD
jgi:iron complex outermembrane receptor protein